MKLINTIILDAEGNILPLDDIEGFQTFFAEVPNIGEEVIIELFENSNIDTNDQANYLYPFLREQFPENKGGQYCFIVKNKKHFRYNNDLWVNIEIQYLPGPVERKEITKSEYLNALEIVETYQQQNQHDANPVKQSAILEIKLSDFLQSCIHMSRRVENILSEYIETCGDVTVESVKKQSFMKLRNAGIKSWHEFIEIRDKYITDKKKAHI